MLGSEAAAFAGAMLVALLVLAQCRWRCRCWPSAGGAAGAGSVRRTRRTHRLTLSHSFLRRENVLGNCSVRWSGERALAAERGSIALCGDCAKDIQDLIVLRLPTDYSTPRSPWSPWSMRSLL